MSNEEKTEIESKFAANQGHGPEHTHWWKRLTKDKGLNGMDGIPPERQNFPDEDPRSEDDRIPEDVRIKQKRLANEKLAKENGGELPEKKEEQTQAPAETADDDQSAKQQAEASIKNDEQKKKPEAKKEEKKADLAPELNEA